MVRHVVRLAEDGAQAESSGRSGVNLPTRAGWTPTSVRRAARWGYADRWAYALPGGSLEAVPLPSR
jgi:hypothetical protein